MQYRWVYFVRGQQPGHVKVGITNDLDKRLRQLKCTLIFAVRSEAAFAEKLERAIHQDLADQRLERSEWFVMDERLLHLIRFVQKRRRWPWKWNTEVRIG